MLAARPPASTAALLPALLLVSCALLPLLAETVDAQSQSYSTQLQMGISNPEFRTQRTFYVPDGQCSAQILPAQVCSGARPLALRVEVSDGAPLPVLQALGTLQTVYVFRASAAGGACAGPAAVRLLLHCPPAPAPSAPPADPAALAPVRARLRPRPAH